MPARNLFAGFCAWPKTLCDFAFSEARLAAISERHPTMAAVDPFRPCRIQHTLSRIQEGALPRQRLAVVPGHPLRRRLLQLFGGPLHLVQIVERVGPVYPPG